MMNGVSQFARSRYTTRLPLGLVTAASAASPRPRCRSPAADRIDRRSPVRRLVRVGLPSCDWPYRIIGSCGSCGSLRDWNPSPPLMMY